MADFKDKFNELNNTPDTTSEYTKEDVEGNKLMGVLAYLGILVLIPIFAAKESKFARFHANQGLVLLIVDIILAIVSSILGKIPLIGWLLGLVIDIIIIALVVIGIINVCNGKAKELPLIGKFKLLK
ncbi:MAG: zinc ribbon domain-containing protein [Clostridia bacterium]|nr:zinc ribbon domain-containing protein [Clostridia bacterium]